MPKNILYFGSKSQSRKMLLEESQIPFVVVDQDADETACDWGLPLPQLVLSIALYKISKLLLLKQAVVFTTLVINKKLITNKRGKTKLILPSAGRLKVR